MQQSEVQEDEEFCRMKKLFRKFPKMHTKV
jgi:hypothetical protein